jgi:type IV pilus assembly protein PilQ
VDVRKALEMLSNEASVSILVAPGVTGKVTANLQGLSFDEALGAILKLCNLVAQRQNDLVFVYPLADVPQLTRSLRAFPLDYVSATDAMLGVQGLLSPSGKAFVMQSSPNDNRKMQNVIVAEDVPDYLLRVEQYLTEIDRPPRQVLIEAHVLEVELKDDRRHGVNFKQIMHIMGNAATFQLKGLADPLAAQAFFVNVDGANLEALVECLKTTTDAKTLASPRVLVLNGQQAHIQIGERFGYRVITTTETSSMQDVKFLDLGVVLTVAPHISRDNQVVMRVKPEVSSGQVNPETDLPEEETTEVETDVLLMDGQGMVIGGLIQEKDSNVQSKIPLLGDIWLIGRLFQRRELVKKRSEIIITLIPRVLPYQPEYEVQEQFDTTRAAAPLLHGPLCRYPRPWEPSLPDTDCRLRDLRCGPVCQ